MKPVLVVGTGRCGSSAMANILIHLGVYMGERFSPPDVHNPRGYFEDLDFKWLHQALLSSDITMDEFCASVMKYAEKRQRYPIWGFKDPRTSQMLPIYRRWLFPDARYIWCQRDPRDTQWSMLRGHQLRGQRGNQPFMIFNTWMIRNMMLEQWLPACDKNALRIHFDDLMERPGWVIEHVCGFLNTAPGNDKIEAAIKTIQPRRETPDGLGAPNLT